MKTPLLIGIIILAAIALLVAVPRISLNTTGGAHLVNSMGETFLLDGQWGYSQYDCDGDRPYLNDYSTATKVSVRGTIPHTGNRVCSNYEQKLTVNLTSMDLREYERVIIHRTGSLTANSREDVRCTSNTMGITNVQERFGQTNCALGLVTITNNHGSIRIDTAQGTQLLVAGNQPVYFSDTVSIHAEAPTYGGELKYDITSIEATPLTPIPEQPSNIAYIVAGIVLVTAIAAGAYVLRSKR